LTHQYKPRLIDSAEGSILGVDGHVYYVNARSNPAVIWTPNGFTLCTANQPYTFILQFCGPSGSGQVGTQAILTAPNDYFVASSVTTFPIPFTSAQQVPEVYNVAIINGPPGGPTEPTYIEIQIVARQLTNQTVPYYVPFQLRWSASAEYLRSQWLARGGSYLGIAGQNTSGIPLLNPCNHTVI
jgi:hypothetical protein